MTRDIGRRRRSASVSICLVALTAAAMTGCSSGPDYQGVCQDDHTSTRVDDEHCGSGGGGSGGSGGHWVYYRNGERVPAVGEKLSGGSLTAPHGASVERGGFGRGGGTVGG
ncbi:MAG TPA: hypothetical protein VFP72_00640 [Kineosporiaceae bacterium]|nr:hypothetical protein [Kineosporiaceae bacterium]